MSVCLSQTLPLSVDPVELFWLFKSEPNVFFLDSSLVNPLLGRYSFIGFDPFETFQGRGEKTLSRLKERFNLYQENIKAPFTPFPSGLVGFLSYDLGHKLENIRQKRKDDQALPDGFFGFYDTVITIDHLAEKIYITSTGFPEQRKDLRSKRAHEQINRIRRKINSCLSTRQPFKFLSQGPSSNNGSLNFMSNFTKKEYCRAIEKALEYIRQGDIYQVNLAQRFCLDIKHKNVDPGFLYLALRGLSPSCFGAYFDAGPFQIISSSPERFLQVTGQVVQTRPMKGTRSRGETKTQDADNRKELIKSPKEKAELLMVTDLERNDLGRVCKFGSIKVKKMRAIESYRTVFQATSTVEGVLQKKKDVFDVLKACFPGGSITGCPKIRAMGIIEELESVPRGIYTGAFGYISFPGDMDLSVLIRTLLIQKDNIYFHVGGGIVADSDPEAEYQETLVKAKAIKECLQRYLG